MGLLDGVSSWLSGARSEDGLLIPGRPAERGCDLLLTVDGVRLRSPDAEAGLAWDALAPGSTSGRDVVGGVDRVRASPYAQGLDVNADDVTAFANQYYVNVDPWPFAALAEE